MKNTLTGSLRSSVLKAALMLSIVGTTNAALVQNLQAQTKGKTQTEQTNKIKSNAEISKEFGDAIGVTITGKWVDYTANILKDIKPREKEFTQNFFKKEIAKIPQKDKMAYTLLALNRISDARNKEVTTTTSDEFEQYFDYMDQLDILIKNYSTERAPIAQKQTNQYENQATKTQKESEEKLLKIYTSDPQNPKLKEVAKSTKETFEKNGYKYSPQTAQMFADLGLK